MTKKPTKSRAKAKKPDTRVNQSKLPFDPDVVCQGARDGTPGDILATGLGIDLAKLTITARKEYEKAYEQGLAQGVAQTFAGLAMAANAGDTKAIQMLLDYTGVQVPTAGEPGDNPGKPSRLLVEVSVADE